MKTTISLYNSIHRVVSFFSKQLKFDKYKKKLGRKLSLTIEESISLAVFKQKNSIPTKKSIYQIFKPKCSYKTLVVNLNRWASLALVIITLLIKINRKNQHIVKHIDSTDIPVCLLKNGKYHKTMQGLASYGRGSKGMCFGLKMHIITDLRRKILAIKFAGANVNDRMLVIPLSRDLMGIFVADGGYLSKRLQNEFYQEHGRILLAKPRATMKKIMTKFEEYLCRTRMLIELNFRNLKMFYGLITSLPRSINGYLANYIYSLLAYQII